MAFYDPTIFEVHVLLVDHDVSSLFETARLLQFNSYKVTPVHDASIASSILSQGDANFNLVMVDVKTSNLQGFKLVHDAVSMDLPVIVMAAIATPTLVKCAIEDGAFLFMQKPTASDELKYLWQHALRETTRRSKEKGKPCGEKSGREDVEVDKMIESVTMNRDLLMNKVNDRRGRREIISFSSDDNNNDDDNVPAGQCTSMKPKMCTEWTRELHEKFMAAVKQLGDGRCFPKDILELMNVPGLTRMQVASHLQKCRHGWQPSNERQGRRPKASKSSNSSIPTQTKTKKYGIIPRLVRGSLPQFPSTNDNQDNEQSVQMAASSNNNSMGVISTPNFCDHTLNNVRRLGTWDITVSDENMISGKYDQGLQSDASVDFVASDHHGLIGNQFNMNDFDLDHTFFDQRFFGGDEFLEFVDCKFCKGTMKQETTTRNEINQVVVIHEQGAKLYI
ncbi:hypothetical protein OROGR_017012 [Orobanche gracilis]